MDSTCKSERRAWRFLPLPLTLAHARFARRYNIVDSPPLGTTTDSLSSSAATADNTEALTLDIEDAIASPQKHNALPPIASSNQLEDTLSNSNAVDTAQAPDGATADADAIPRCISTADPGTTNPPLHKKVTIAPSAHPSHKLSKVFTWTEIEDAVKFMDKNGDGEISFEELR